MKSALHGREESACVDRRGALRCRRLLAVTRAVVDELERRIDAPDPEVHGSLMAQVAEQLERLAMALRDEDDKGARG